jgi:hypothetical protein
MKKRTFLILCLTLLIGAGVAWQLWPESGIGPVRFHRVKIGMSQENVEAVIGMPLGDYSKGGTW